VLLISVLHRSSLLRVFAGAVLARYSHLYAAGSQLRGLCAAVQILSLVRYTIKGDCECIIGGRHMSLNLRHDYAHRPVTRLR
jgi:hypothetical protein